MEHTPSPRNSTLAIISLVAGILGLTVLFGVGSIVAVITGHMAKNEITKSDGSLGGSGMATAGLITGYVGIALLACICLIFALSFAGIFTLPFLIPTSSY